jgi:ferredoxin-nitrite reductase
VTVAAERKPTQNKFEKLKAAKDGLEIKKDLAQIAQMGWEAMDEDDRIHRLKWVGVFFRPVTPGKFMLRLRLPSGIATSEQFNTLATIAQRYGDDGCIDITTRQNLQLRGIVVEDIPDIFDRLDAVGLTSIQSGMDNVRNITASPVAGIDADELFDTRDLAQQIQDMITGAGQGNPEFSNLPRKFNIAIEGGRDNSIHAEINDVAFVPAFREGAQGPEFGFNVVVGGFFSATRVAPAIPLGVWVSPDQVVALCRSILEVFRDHGPRANRQKSRLMWLIDEWGIDKFRAELETSIGHPLATAAPKDAMDWQKRDHIGVFAQKQAGLNYVGLQVPVGRLMAEDLFSLAQLAEVYGSGELRLTIEQNVILTNVPDAKLAALQQEPLLQRFSIDPSPLVRSLVSCTGAQFCSFAMVETKNRALALAHDLEAELDIPEAVRMHWTGCPNSCGQPQVAAIGLMGTKARGQDGKATEGVDIFMGGRVGPDAHLGTKVIKAIPVADLQPVLRQLLIDQFGATPKAGLTFEPIEIPMIAPKVEVAAAAKAVVPATLVLAATGQEIPCDSSQSILQIATAAGLSLDSSCQSGTCGTCKQRVDGPIDYVNEPAALSEADRAAGYALICSAHPTGRVVLQ